MLLTRCMLKVEDKKKGEGGRKMVQKFLSERKNQESEIHQMATVGNLVEKTSRVWVFHCRVCICVPSVSLDLFATFSTKYLMRAWLA